MGGSIAGGVGKIISNGGDKDKKICDGLGEALLIGLGAGIIGGGLGQALGGLADKVGDKSLYLIKGIIAGGIGGASTASLMKLVDNII